LKLSSQKGGEIYQVGISWEKKKKETRGSGRKKIFSLTHLDEQQQR
jgi:hypothetical protein